MIPEAQAIAIAHGARLHALASHPSRAAGDLTRRRVRFRLGLGLALNPDLFRLLRGFLLVCDGGVLLHASAVVERERAWVFSGPSGSGKTTIAQLAGDRPVLNDETVTLRPGPRAHNAYATPFYGRAPPRRARLPGTTSTRSPTSTGETDGSTIALTTPPGGRRLATSIVSGWPPTRLSAGSSTNRLRGRWGRGY